MYDRTAIMRTAWRRYRENRAAGTSFSRSAFAAALASAWVMTKARPAIMANAWAHYRDSRSSRMAFCRLAFDRCLRQAWTSAKMRAAYAAERREASPHLAPIAAPALSPMEQRIDALKYLSARYRIDLMEREIRAEYGVAA